MHGGGNRIYGLYVIIIHNGLFAEYAKSLIIFEASVVQGNDLWSENKDKDL